MTSILTRLLNIMVYRPLLRVKLKRCGENFRIGYSSELLNPGYFSIGKNFFSGPYGYFVTNRFIPVEIGNDVMFGPFCKIFGGDHDWKYKKKHIYYAPEKEVVGSKITIEDGVWVGANTSILTNAFIAEGSVIASGAIVNGYVPPYCIAYGIPVKKMKPRFNKSELIEVLNNVNSKYSLNKIETLYKKHGINIES